MLVGPSNTFDNRNPIHGSHREQAIAHFQAGDLTLAQVVGLSAAERRALRAEIRRLVNSRSESEALRLSLLLILHDPYNPRAWRELAEIHEGMANYRAALTSYTTAIMMGAEPERLYPAQQRCLAQLSDLETGSNPSDSCLGSRR